MGQNCAPSQHRGLPKHSQDFTEHAWPVLFPFECLLLLPILENRIQVRLLFFFFFLFTPPMLIFIFSLFYLGVQFLYLCASSHPFPSSLMCIFYKHQNCLWALCVCAVSQSASQLASCFRVLCAAQTKSVFQNELPSGQTILCFLYLGVLAAAVCECAVEWPSAHLSLSDCGTTFIACYCLKLWFD